MYWAIYVHEDLVCCHRQLSVQACARARAVSLRSLACVYSKIACPYCVTLARLYSGAESQTAPPASEYTTVTSTTHPHVCADIILPDKFESVRYNIFDHIPYIPCTTILHIYVIAKNSKRKPSLWGGSVEKPNVNELTYS